MVGHFNLHPPDGDKLLGISVRTRLAVGWPVRRSVLVRRFCGGRSGEGRVLLRWPAFVSTSREFSLFFFCGSIGRIIPSPSPAPLLRRLMLTAQGAVVLAFFESFIRGARAVCVISRARKTPNVFTNLRPFHHFPRWRSGTVRVLPRLVRLLRRDNMINKPEPSRSSAV